MVILSQTKGYDGYHGTVGTPTNMCDSDGDPLFVGDIVYMRCIDSTITSVEFVCEEDHRFAKWRNRENQYVMGVADVWNSDKFKQITEAIDGEDLIEQINALSEGWIVTKIKDFAELAIGERWGFISVVEVKV